MQEVWFLCSACMIMLIDIYMKFHGDSLNHFQVIEWTRFCDRQTDRRPGEKTIHMSLYPKGRRHKYKNRSSSGRGHIACGADLVSTGIPIQGGQYLEQNR